MKIRDWMIRRLGGYTKKDMELVKSAARGNFQAVTLAPVRLRCAQILSRAADAEDGLVRENMAYRLAGEMLHAEAIRYTLTEDQPSGLPKLTAEAWVVRKD